MTKPETVVGDAAKAAAQTAAKAAARSAAKAAASTPQGRLVIVALIVLAVTAAGGMVLLAAAADDGAGPVTDIAAGPIPATAVAAYIQAAARAGELVDGCAVRPAVVAAIGRVESIHGTLGGSAPQPDGTVVPPIIGIALDGRGPVAAITDTDDGRLDGDTTWDRAVGPMQFIPGSWQLFGVDGNGDGTADPHNLFDAATAAVMHLCRAAPADLNTDPDALRTAILAYNHSEVYLADVLSFVALYDVLLGDGTRPPVTAAGGTPAQMLLAHPGFSGTPGAVGDLQAGIIDGRLVTILVMLADVHPIFVGGFKTYHSQCVGGGSLASRPDCTESHHYHGRGADVFTVAGTAVTAANGAAHQLVQLLATTTWTDPAMAPDVGSPWPAFDPLPGFFHDAAHRDHLHVDVCGPRYSRGVWTDSC